jgi:hypothetical protein
LFSSLARHPRRREEDSHFDPKKHIGFTMSLGECSFSAEVNSELQAGRFLKFRLEDAEIIF